MIFPAIDVPASAPPGGELPSGTVLQARAHAAREVRKQVIAQLEEILQPAPDWDEDTVEQRIKDYIDYLQAQG